ncbi:MAG: glycosyltransferase [Thermodesulfobacteriota bacterium]
MNRAEKIAILGTLPPLRGLSSYCLELALAMAEVASVEFISFKSLYPAFAYPGGGLNEDDTFPGLEHPNLKVDRQLTWYNPISWIKAGLFNNARLLHAQWWSPPLFPIYLAVCGTFKARRKPVVFTVHNTQPHEKSFLFQKISGVLFKLGDHFIVHTAVNKQQLVANYGIPPEKINLIPHGTLDFHVKQQVDRESIRTALGFTSSSKVILLFGAIRSYKGIDTALKAFAPVLRHAPDSRLLIAGKLWESWEPYSKLIEELNLKDTVLTHLEYIPSGDVYKFFTAADIVILPYHHFSSQSGVGASAVSFRKPLIVSRVGGLPDLVADPRSIVPPGDPAALANILIECLKSPGRLADMAAGADMVARELTWSAIAKETTSVYRKVLKASDTINGE